MGEDEIRWMECYDDILHTIVDKSVRRILDGEYTYYELMDDVEEYIDCSSVDLVYEEIMKIKDFYKRLIKIVIMQRRELEGNRREILGITV